MDNIFLKSSVWRNILVQESNELMITNNTDENKFVSRYMLVLKKKKKKNEEETLHSSRQKWRNNEVDVKLFCNTKCQKARAHYLHYMKKRLCPLWQNLSDCLSHGRWEKDIHWLQGVRKWAILIISLGKIVEITMY